MTSTSHFGGWERSVSIGQMIVALPAPGKWHRVIPFILAYIRTS
jgi:hypothetical protein